MPSPVRVPAPALEDPTARAFADATRGSRPRTRGAPRAPASWRVETRWLWALVGAAMLAACATVAPGDAAAPPAANAAALPPPTSVVVAAKVSTDGQPVAMLVVERRRPNLVPVSINGSEPHRFVLDTGSDHTVISPALARKLGIQPRQTVNLAGAGGTRQGRVGVLASLAIGGARIDGAVPVVIGDEQTFSATGVRDVDGVVGADFLRHFHVTMDFPNLSVTFKRQRSLGAAALHGGVQPSGPSPAAPGSAPQVLGKVRFEPQPQRSLIVIDAWIDDRGPHRLLLDTGADITLVTPEVADSAALPRERSTQIQGVAGSQTVGIATARTLGIKGIRAESAWRIGVIDLSPRHRAQFDGVLGMDFLRLMRVTIDYTDKTVTFEGRRGAGVGPPTQPARID
jgi:predicted aspartyl protease